MKYLMMLAVAVLSIGCEKQSNTQTVHQDQQKTATPLVPTVTSPTELSLDQSVSQCSTIEMFQQLMDQWEWEQLVEVGPVSTATSRKLFALLVAGTPYEDQVIAVGQFAAYTGDTELLRKSVYTYFGSAEGEAKMGYVERFIMNHPHLFFSLPDAEHLWHEAGGAELGFDYPDAIKKILDDFAFSSLVAQNLLIDINANEADPH